MILTPGEAKPGYMTVRADGSVCVYDVCTTEANANGLANAYEDHNGTRPRVVPVTVLIELRDKPKETPSC